MTTVDNHHMVNSHTSIQVTDNDRSAKADDGKVVVDEEIDSCEGEDYDEKKMFQVALVNSVMDTGGNGDGSALSQEAPGDMSPRSKARYALRKRRRPGDEVTAPPPLEPESTVDFLEMPNDPLNELQHVQDSMVSVSMPPIQMPVPTPIKTKQETSSQPLRVPMPSNINIKSEPQRQQSTRAPAGGHSQLGIISKPPNTTSAVLPKISAPIPQQGRQNQPTNLASSAKPMGMKKKPLPRKRKPKTHKPTAKTNVAERLAMPVPNPLLASTPPPHASMNHSSSNGRHDSVIPSTSSVPCPLPVPSPLDSVGDMRPPKRATYVPFDPSKLTKVSETSVAKMEMPLPSRTRVFSVDLDPSTFDFSDLSSITGGNTDAKISADSDLPIFNGRDRAFSFEVFNFAGGDDLLPNPVSNTSMLQAPSLAPVSVDLSMRRPRGDSIIFDPSSFQDGGIHEKNALEKARLKDLLPPPQQSLAHPANQRRVTTVSSGGITGTYSTSQSNNPMPLMLPPGSSLNRSAPMAAGQNRAPHQGQGNNAATATSKARTMTSTATIASSSRTSLSSSVQMATLPSSLSGGVSTSAQSPPTFQMELLNKDGRIGIYLPEARRLRIARFHAKRKMRIWRKRIKYDCRKKLADSRPRIKGRFVKRSDMD
jgi:hypothetical protein